MSRHEYLKAERERVKYRASANARSIVKIEPSNGKYHVIIMTQNGRIIHEAVDTHEAAEALIEALDVIL